MSTEFSATTPPDATRHEAISLTTRTGGASADVVLRMLTSGAAVVVILMLASLIAVLTSAAMPSIKEYGWSFITSTDWRPNEIERPLKDAAGKRVFDEFGEPVMEVIPPEFGAANVIYGTTVSSLIALLFAVPLSLGAALFLIRISPALPKICATLIYVGVGAATFFMVAWVSGYRPVGLIAAGIISIGVATVLIRYVPSLTTAVSFLIEFLAAIPSIAYGIWGLFVMTPFLQSTVEPTLQKVLGGVPGFAWLFQQSIDSGNATRLIPIPLTGRDMFAGGLILSIMIVPIITAISRDVLRGVPRAQLEGTTALGATWWQSSKEMLKYGRAGLFGAVMLGLARAAGETMAVTMVIGNRNQIAASPLAPAQTMSSLLANEFAEVTNEMHRSSLIEVALVLLVMSLAFNIIARWLVVGGQARTAAAH